MGENKMEKNVEHKYFKEIFDTLEEYGYKPTAGSENIFEEQYGMEYGRQSESDRYQSFIMAFRGTKTSLPYIRYVGIFAHNKAWSEWQISVLRETQNKTHRGHVTAQHLTPDIASSMFPDISKKDLPKSLLFYFRTVELYTFPESNIEPDTLSLFLKDAESGMDKLLDLLERKDLSKIEEFFRERKVL